MAAIFDARAWTECASTLERSLCRPSGGARCPYKAAHSRITRWRSTIFFTHVQVTSHSFRVSETKSRHLATLAHRRLESFIVSELVRQYLPDFGGTSGIGRSSCHVVTAGGSLRSFIILFAGQFEVVEFMYFSVFSSYFCIYCMTYRKPMSSSKSIG